MDKKYCIAVVGCGRIAANGSIFQPLRRSETCA